MSEPENINQALGRLEPGSGWEGVVYDKEAMPDRRIQLSIAISMKRIADSLDGTNGLPIWQAIEQAIGTGMFDGFQNLKR